MSTRLVFNGINAETGEYDVPPMTAEELARIAAKLEFDAKHLDELKWRSRQIRDPHYAPIEGVDPKDLAQAGWGVIFAHNADPGIREALKPLLELRRSQASRIKENRYREFTGQDGFWSPDETKPEFLDRHGAGGGGSVDPDQIPYYLLIVGDPEAIPFSFQYQLDVQYAVGRVSFASREEYAMYARSVVEAESGRVALARRATFFGVANEGDLATELSCAELVMPLAKAMAEDQKAWEVHTVSGEAATKAGLGELMGGPKTPALLFSASHGMCLRIDNPRLMEHQGAVLCQDWPGPSWKQRVPEEFFFAGSDLAANGSLLGTIFIPFACFGAGTPEHDDFAAEGAAKPKALAPRPFVSRLPQRMLAHPKGGALAVVGHVDRAWAYSFKSGSGETQLRVFKSVLKRLMEGHPVGSALEYFNNRYSELASDLALRLRAARMGKVLDEYELSSMWACNNDARNYLVMGDPAARLPLTDKSSDELRPKLEAIAVQSPTPITPAAIDYGLLDSLRSAQTQVSQTVQQVLEKLTVKLGELVDNIVTVEVATYTAGDLASVKEHEGHLQGASLRALTRVRLDGNTIVCVPERDGKIDESLWKVHSDMVEQALANRRETLKLAVSAASSLLGGLKPT